MSSLKLEAQNFLYAVFVGDTAILSVSGATDSIQWQQSTDSLNWSDISGAKANPQTIITTSSGTGKRFFRTKVTDTLCPNATPFYSSVIRHKILTSISQLQIGYWYRGGIIFYISSPGHGLIAATQDQSTGIQWGCAGTLIGPGAQSTTNGAANTIANVAFHNGLTNYYGNPTQCNPSNNGTVAAKLCDDLTLNGYNDWFLPAKDQLNLLYLQMQNNIVDGFSTGSYWSSTEYSAINAWCLGFITGSQYYNTKNNSNYVRCVRSF